MSFGESLRTLAGDSDALVGFAIAAGIVLVLTPLVGRLAPPIGGLDDKADRPRVHKGAIPRIGGLAIVAGILVPTAILIDLDGPYLGIFIGTLLWPRSGSTTTCDVTPSRKLVGVMVIALIPVVGLRRHVRPPDLPGRRRLRHRLGAYPLTILWIALLANLVNLIDGMDSLAAGIVAIAAAAFAILSASFGRTDAAVLSAIVCGSTLAFLFHNYHPAKIFMGDSGALALGFLLATVASTACSRPPPRSRWSRRCSCSPCRSSTRRSWCSSGSSTAGPPWRADHNHFYHRFMRIGFSQRRTAAYLHVWAGTMAATRCWRASCRPARAATGTCRTRCCWPAPGCS